MKDNIQRQSQPAGKISLSSEEAKEIAVFVSKKFTEFKQARRSKEKKWDECLKAFASEHNYELSEARKWRSKVYVPLSYEAATNIYSNLKRSIFPTDSTFFTVEGTDDYSEMHTNHVKSFLLQQLEKMNFITKFGDFLKQLVVIGNSAACVYWKTVTRQEREKELVPTFDNDGIPTGIEEQMILKERVIYNGPEFETVNMLDLVFDPSQTSWENGMIIHRTYRTLDQVKSNPVYKNTAELMAYSQYSSEETATLNNNMLEMSTYPEKKDNSVKLYSAYGDFKVGKKVYYDYIAVVANDTHLIRFEPNPYPSKPFIFSRYETVPNELYGIGAIEPGLGIQYLVNTFSNQKADVLSLVINGMWMYVDDGIIDPEEIVARPGALIAVKDPRNIQPLHPDSSVGLAYNEIAQLKAEYQEVTGATKYVTGAPNKDYSKTATEVSTLHNAGNIRFSDIIQNIEQNALKRTIHLIHTYNSSFARDINLLRTMDEGDIQYINLTKDILGSDYNFRIIGANSSITKQIRINKLVEFINIVSSNPVIANSVNIIELVKHLYRELGFKDENSIFTSYVTE